MGASNWIYYVAYEENLDQAFQSLRQHIFEAGNYMHSGQQPDDQGQVLTIEDIVKRSGSARTHSLLDISHLITDSQYYSGVPLPEEIIPHILEGKNPTQATIEAIVFQQEIWSRLNGWFLAERLHIAKGFPTRRVFGFSQETLEFFAVERTKEEIVQAFLAQEAFWRDIHHCLCFEIENLAMRTRIGTAMPFSQEKLLRFFRNEKPERSVVEAVFEQSDIWKVMQSDVGYYVIIYQNGVPNEIVFAGFSGD